MKTMWLTVWIAVSVGMLIHNATGAEARPTTGEAAKHLTDVEKAWLTAHPEVRWGVDPHWPPFSSFNRTGELVGIDADITRLVATRVGLRLKIVRAASWEEILAKAEKGEADFLSATAETHGRLECFAFSDAYGAFPVVIIQRDDAPFFTSPHQFESMSLAIKRDDVIALHLQHEFPTARLVPVESPEKALKMLSQGDVDAVVQNLAVATRAIRLGGLANLKISGVTRYEFPLHFAVHKSAPELVSILNKGLASITPREMEAIYAAHLTPDIARARDWGAWRRRASYSLLIGAGIAGAVMYWNIRLARQIHERKAIEADLRDARDGLERRTEELGVRVAEVEQLNQELQLANRDLESFSSSVSHDLRAPLRRIAAYADLLKAEAGNCPADQAEAWMSVIITESKNMDRLIHDLLEFSRIGRTELRKQPVNMRHVVESVVQEFQPQLRDRRVAWEIGDLGEVSGDPNLLRSAMANLIDNSLKYTRRRDEARIRIDGLADGAGGKEAVLFVQDNGCGFDMKQAKFIFAPFERLHSSKDYEGTGIGLANVERIIQRHGGRIWCDSEPDKGATFYFTLPRSQIHTPTA